MSPLMIALLLLVVGLALVVLEMFLPSAGVLGFLAAVCLGGAVVYAYLKLNMAVGTAFLATVVVMVPILMGIAIRTWPQTPIGRMILLDGAIDGSLAPPQENPLTSLIGQRGLAKSVLLPGGVAEIDGKFFDVIALGAGADRGDLIEVVEVEGNRILVVKFDPEDEPDDTQDRRLETTPQMESLQNNLFDEDPFA